MGRPKGSKNKSTILREQLKAIGDKPAAVAVQPIILPPASVTPKPVVVDRPAEYEIYWRRAAHRIELLRMYYSGGEIPERIWDALDLTWLADSAISAEKAASKAVDKYHMFILNQWSIGNVTGPETADSLKKRINSRIGCAKLARDAGYIEKAQEYENEIVELEKLLANKKDPAKPWQSKAWDTI